jgi:transposase
MHSWPRVWCSHSRTGRGYADDVSDDEWASETPYLTLMRGGAPQREHSLCDVFNCLRYIVRTGMQWRMMPSDLRQWYTVCQQTQRWPKAVSLRI